jgi:anti-sigma factor RsiW
MKKARAEHCNVLLERLSAYLDGDLPAPQCRTIERHARGCRRCTKMMVALRQTVRLCKSAATRPLPADVRRRARTRVRALLRATR